MCAICSIAQRVQKYRKGMNNLLTTEQLTHTVLLNASASKSKKLSSCDHTYLATSLEHFKNSNIT
jgi:hypothetical protein